MAAQPVPEPVIAFQLNQLIGNGNYADVYIASRTDTEEKEEFVIKAVRLALDDTTRNNHVNLLTLEFHRIRKLSHPNVVRHIAAQFVPAASKLLTPSFHIHMEYCAGGPLHTAVTHRLSLLYLRKWSREILHGLEYLHENGKIHRDIKGLNILLTSENWASCTVKIADLEDVKHLKGDITAFGEVSLRGTPSFMSPEIIAGNVSEEFNTGRKTDIWSFGCVLIQMLTGAIPQFINDQGNEVTGEAVKYFVTNGGSPKIPDNLPCVIREFIEMCIQREPSNRPSASQLLDHDFYKYH